VVTIEIERFALGCAQLKVSHRILMGYRMIGQNLVKKEQQNVSHLQGLYD
jgi:hypothetical protein